MKGIIKHYFPGGNTSKGFYSYYRYILSQNEATRIICIKGGPGTGKSTLMKKIGAYFNDKGYNIEYHHCSSDNNSLDGVVITGLNVAILDGTSPHVVDPINPGAVDEILNMGECWKEEGFKKYRNDIMSINKDVGKFFKSAYRYIGSSKPIYEEWCSYYSDNLNHSKLNTIVKDLKSKIFKQATAFYGHDRHLFATAFTPNGIITFIDSLIKDIENVYILKGNPGTGKNYILDCLHKEALSNGYFVEVYHKPLIPEKIEHIIIPKLKTAIVTENEISKVKFNGYNIDLDNLVNRDILLQYTDRIENAKNTFYSLLDSGLSMINKAKKAHDEMEIYYIKNMDFDKVNLYYENILYKLLQYEYEYLNK